ncbi:MAG: hypothetical protein QF522_01475 [Acidimicrobiales bacterium]|nr:hypothetical protein [Acidimicrobiales bacterium]
MDATTLRFAEAARSLGMAARLRGLQVPTFRSPPGITDVQRSIRRRGQSSTVAVVLKGRPWAAVVADMIEGILVANRLDNGRADMVRSALWLAVEDPVLAA